MSRSQKVLSPLGLIQPSWKIPPLQLSVKMKTRLLCGLIAAILLGPWAHADIISFAGTTGWVPTRLAPRTLQVQGFDSTLGTLTQVNLTFSAMVMQIGNVENTSASAPMAYSWSGSADVSLAKSVGGPAIFAAPTGTFSYAQSGTLTDPFSGLTTTIQNKTWAPLSSLDSALSSYSSPGKLNFSLLATALNDFTVAPGWDLVGGVDTTVNATLKIDYTYAQIPEPATYAAWLGLSVLGVAAWRRRAAQPVGPTYQS